jgi:hypothetical protein
MPEQLHAEFIVAADVPALTSGELTRQALRVTAKALVLIRYPLESGRLPDLNSRRIGD